jgi:hypothetical protein
MKKGFQIVRRGDFIPVGSVAAKIIARLEQQGREQRNSDDADEQSDSDPTPAHGSASCRTGGGDG